MAGFTSYMINHKKISKHYKPIKSDSINHVTNHKKIFKYYKHAKII